MPAVETLLAKDLIGILNSALDRDPVFCIIRTYCGVPAIILPLLEAENRLRTRARLVGRCGNDIRQL